MSGSLMDLWNWFADTQCRNYSPIYERVCRKVAESEEVLNIVRRAPPEGHMPPLLLAAVHYLTLSGVEHPLADVYAGRSELDPGPLFVDLCLAHSNEIGHLLRSRHVNTNEVGRSALLGPALTEFATQMGQPLGLVDVGCSAGLNMQCDRYFLDYGSAGATGPLDSEIRITCDVLGGSPPIASRLPAIDIRIGLDLNPVDVTDDEAIRWQLACVWPDTGRFERTRAALNLVCDAKLSIIQGDAVEALPGILAALPEHCVPVVITTWALAYLPPDRREDFVRVMRDASRKRPIGWISGEGEGVVPELGDVS